VGRVWPRHGHRGRPLNWVVRQHMKRSWQKLGAVSAVGLAAPLWWTWAVSQLSYAVYLASGSPERPSRAFFLASLYGSSFVIGLVAGVVITVLSAPIPMKGWLLFVGSVLVGSLAAGAFFGDPLGPVGSLVASPGTWCFFVGAALAPLIAYVRKRAV